jgi:hypothetical protein
MIRLILTRAGGYKMDKSPTELYAERLKRIDDAIQLRLPDRVPIWLKR